MKEALAYDISFDQQLARENGVDEKRALSFIFTQIETHLGERFHVLLSQYEYEIHDNQMWGEDMNEPAIESFIRGRDLRRFQGRLVDRDREEAEIVGFQKIQDNLCEEDTDIGTSMVSVSPPGQEGTNYLHNFYDIFTLKIDSEGQRYVETKRYSSVLSIEDYVKKLSVFGRVDIDENDPAASLLSSPILISRLMSPEDLHLYLHEDHDVTDKELFRRIIEGTKSLTEKYATAVIENPNNDFEHKIIFNAILNKADDIERQPYHNIVYFPERIIQEDIARYGYQEVREVATGCGASGGYEIGKEQMNSPFSVLEFASNDAFGKDKYGERKFSCPQCKKTNIRPKNKLLDECQHCKSTKVAC